MPSSRLNLPVGALGSGPARAQPNPPACTMGLIPPPDAVTPVHATRARLAAAARSTAEVAIPMGEPLAEAWGRSVSGRRPLSEALPAGFIVCAGSDSLRRQC